MIIITCQHFLGKTFFVRFLLTVFENKRTFMKKAALFSTNKENRSDIINYIVMKDLNL